MSQSTNPQVQAGPQGSVPPGGPPNPNPTDHNLIGIAADRGPIVIGVVSFLWALTIVALSLRVISRYIAKCKWWWDDYLALVAWVKHSSRQTVFLI